MRPLTLLASVLALCTCFGALRLPWAHTAGLSPLKRKCCKLYVCFVAALTQYLDQIHDLLGSGERMKHEVRHSATHTEVSNAVIASLHAPADVYPLLERAKSRRQVAATRMNERSSRSHSVFALRVRGTNAATGEMSDATLNMVDLAGSERLATSGSASNPARLREAQSINKSLSSLADVIAALAQHGRHVPYRNSTLTWLLKPSLGGNSKTYVPSVFY